MKSSSFCIQQILRVTTQSREDITNQPQILYLGRYLYKKSYKKDYIHHAKMAAAEQFELTMTRHEPEKL